MDFGKVPKGESMKFSVVIPTYNSQNSLEIALASVACQSFQDWEILIIDGQSTDNTLSIANRFSLSDCRIKIYSEPDKGIYDAMNKGINRSKGEWLYFMGCDDKLLNEDVLAKINTEISDEIDVLYGDVVSPRFNGRYDGPFNEVKIFNQNICHQSIFFRKRVFDKTGCFDLKFTAHADWDHNMKWILNRKVKKKYFNTIVAEYADGGFSSLNGDLEFENEKKFKYLKYAGLMVYSDFQIRLIKMVLKDSIKSRDFNRIPFCTILYIKTLFYT